MRKSWRIRRTTLLIFGLVAFLLGLGFARTKIYINSELVLISFLIFITTAFRQKVPALIGVVILGFVLGWIRGQVFLSTTNGYKYIDGKHIVANVQVESDAIYDDKKMLSFDASHLHVVRPVEMDLPGSILIAGFGEPAIYKGDLLNIEGKIFRSRGRHQMRMSFADIEVIGRNESTIDNTRREFAAGMETALPEPLSSFGLGLLIGQRNNLPRPVSDQLAAVGLTHIIAVSGYNLTIIMRAIRRLLSKRSKYQTAVISLLLMTMFLLATGFSASIVRASIVSGLSLMAWYYGRTIRPVLVIVLAAALTAGWNPFYLWSDIGWYLSFLAFYGVIVLAPQVTKRIFGNKQPRNITAIFTECVCALIMTVPLVMFIFHQVSIVALIANLLIVPLVPIGMLLALVAGISGMVVPILSGVVAMPARVLLTYMLDLVHIMSRIPHALVQVKLSLHSVLFLYACIALTSVIMWQTTSRNGKITDINIEE